MYEHHDQQYITELILSKISSSRSSIKSQWENPEETNTRHFVIDELLEPTICTRIYDSFPKDGHRFYSRKSFRERKKTSGRLSDYDEVLSHITFALQDPRVVALISEIVGIDRLEPDPKLYAGGLSMMFAGDFLNPHIDNSHDAERKRYRRLNLLYYVSPDWKLENGGNFELWNSERTRPKTILAAANRLVVMETNKYSWHSVSKVQTDNPRCCVSNYYFSDVSPDLSSYFHVTSFVGRPNELFKRVWCVLDNAARNTFSIVTKIGRGKDQVNKDNTQ
jgi:Rps23 Pro-64 3,4-dihydroxylase Tpa1-like proline 4-hydroxylase